MEARGCAPYYCEFTKYPQNVIQCLDVCVQVCMCSSVEKNLLKINLQVWFHFIAFLRSFKYKQQMVCKTILYNIYEAGSVLLSPSASCLKYFIFAETSIL